MRRVATLRRMPNRACRHPARRRTAAGWQEETLRLPTRLTLALRPGDARAFELRAAVVPVARAMCDRIRKNRGTRDAMLTSFGGDKQGPYLYLIVATGNIPQFVEHLKAKGDLRLGMDVFVPKA